MIRNYSELSVAKIGMEKMMLKRGGQNRHRFTGVIVLRWILDSTVEVSRRFLNGLVEVFDLAGIITFCGAGQKDPSKRS